MMTPQDWLWAIGLGSSCGFLGQCLRVVVGLRKAADAGGAPFDAARLCISLLLGAAAGGLASLVVLKVPGIVSSEQVLGLVAAGYSGSDFLEGFLGKYLPH